MSLSEGSELGYLAILLFMTPLTTWSLELPTIKTQKIKDKSPSLSQELELSVKPMTPVYLNELEQKQYFCYTFEAYPGMWLDGSNSGGGWQNREGRREPVWPTNDRHFVFLFYFCFFSSTWFFRLKSHNPISCSVFFFIVLSFAVRQFSFYLLTPGSRQAVREARWVYNVLWVRWYVWWE